MSEQLTKTVINCETGEVQVLPLSEEELEQVKIDKENFEIQKAENDAKVAEELAVKNSIIQKLVLGQPLTEEEANRIVF